MRRAEIIFHRRCARGFTLLEIVLAMFVLALLVSSIFGIVSGTTQLADEMERAHERDAQSHSFAQFCERTLRQLPAEAQVRLKVKQSGKQYLSQLAILNAPSVLGAANGGSNGLTILEMDQQPDGYLRAILTFVPATEITAHEAEGGKGGQSLVLLTDVARLEWKFFNSLTNEWEPMWNPNLVFTSPAEASALPTLGGQPPLGGQTPPPAPGGAPFPMTGGGTLQLQGAAQRPGLIELTLAQRAEPPRRFVFWVPPAQVPTGTAVAPPQPVVPPPK